MTFCRSLLLAWGRLTLIGVIAVAGVIAYKIGPGNRTRDDSASPRDVRFVLNWCRLGDQRITSVVHSHVSARSLTGDHLDAYAIKISHVEPAELVPKTAGDENGWYRGDQLPRVLDDAVAIVSKCRFLLPSWFPVEADLKTSEFYAYSCRVNYHGVEAYDATLIFVRPADKMVFYFDVKT